MIQFDIYIDSTKTIYADQIPSFVVSENWGNLGNKVLFILNRLDYLNDILASIFQKVENINHNRKLRNGMTDNKTAVAPYIEIIHVMSDMRMIIDELIALLYIVEKRKEIGDYPDLIEIDSIGALLKKWENGEFDELCFFVDFKDFIKTINEITNTYKHSFINDHIIFFRQLDTPIVYAWKNKAYKQRNKFERDENKFIAIPLKDIVGDFNKMFSEYQNVLKKETDEQIIKYYGDKKKGLS